MMNGDNISTAPRQCQRAAEIELNFALWAN